MFIAKNHYYIHYIRETHYAYIETTIVKKERNFMKNFIKIIVIFEIAIFASPVHSMEQDQIS